MLSPDGIRYDNDGLIVHTNTADGSIDGGDTAQREGWYWIGVWIRQNILHNPWPYQRDLTYEAVMHLLEPKGDGIFYRHPRLPPWNNPFDQKFGFSRDQMVPLVAAMGFNNDIPRLRRLWNALPQDRIGGTKHTFNGQWQNAFGIAQAYYTGDIVGPSTINLFRRAWGEDPAAAGDGNGPGGEQELTANIALRLPPIASDRDQTGDDLNLIVQLLTAIERFPFTGDVGRLIPSTAQQVLEYSKDRLVSYGSFVGAYQIAYGVDVTALLFDATIRKRLDDGIASGWQTDASRVFGAIRWYHRVGIGANPGLAELYRPIVRAFLE